MDLHNPRNPYGSSEDVAVFDIFTWAVGACLEAEECHLAPMGLSQSPWAGITVISLTHTTVRNDSSSHATNDGETVSGSYY